MFVIVIGVLLSSCHQKRCVLLFVLLLKRYLLLLRFIIFPIYCNCCFNQYSWVSVYPMVSISILNLTSSHLLYYFILPDKQQELDLPTVKVDHVEHPVKERTVEGKSRPMCQISGLRKLRHANSFTGIVPAHGVETPHKEELTKVR